MCGLDERQSLDAFKVCLHVGIWGSVELGIWLPGQHDVQVSISNGELATHDESLALDESIVDVFKLGIHFTKRECSHLIFVIRMFSLEISNKNNIKVHRQKLLG